MDGRLYQYFDRMAQVIRIILDQGSIKERDTDSLLYDEECRAYSLLRVRIPELIGEDRIVKNLALCDLTDRFFSEMDRIIRDKRKDILTVLLYFMDRGIIECYRRNIDFEDDVEMLDALNQNVEQSRIILLRKTDCNWAFCEKTMGIQMLLYHFYFVDRDMIRDMCLKNYFLDESIMFPYGKSSLRIAISPLTREKVVNFSKPYERINDKTGARQQYFRVESIMREDELTLQVLENMYCAGKDGADILVFPEMLGTSKMLEHILSLISQQDSEKVPALVVFPSIWEKTAGDENNTNRSCLILQGNEILFEQHKRCDFKYLSERGPVYEDINRYDSGHNIMNLLHVEGLGRICIIICVDFLVTQNRDQIVKNLCPTLVCSLSFSTGSFHFRTLGEACFYQGCNWVWCNTCSAANETSKLENFKSVGMITTLCKNNDLSDESSFKRQFSGKTECKKANCQKCIYYAEIPLVLDISLPAKGGKTL